jgi:hypothetical protein
MTDFDDRRNPPPQQPFHPAPPDEVSNVDTAQGTETIEKDPIFQQQVQRLHHFTVYSRWLLVAALWVLIAPISLWALRSEFALWRDYFTWTAVRYTIVYNRLPALGLILCIALTIAILVWQSRNILRGMPQEYVQRLEEQVLQIRRQGKSHPLWKWVCEKQQ